jgi:hypothetical protein
MILSLLTLMVSNSVGLSPAMAQGAPGGSQPRNCTKELEFSGFVRHIRRESASHGPQICVFRIELESAFPDKNCPLTVQEASEMTFADSRCRWTEGKRVTGIMSLRNGNAAIDSID